MRFEAFCPVGKIPSPIAARVKVKVFPVKACANKFCPASVKIKPLAIIKISLHIILITSFAILINLLSGRVQVSTLYIFQQVQVQVFVRDCQSVQKFSSRT